MRGLMLILLLAITAFTTGCPQGPSKKFPGATNSKSLVANINSYLTGAQTLFNNAIAADPTDASGNAQRIRNDAIDDVLAVIDDNYNDYISSIEERRSRTDFVLDVIELGTAAATGITKGERPNQILGIALTAFRGGRRSSELNFYKQQTTPILINKMDDNRAIALADILNNRTTSATTYSMKTAIRDLVDYYNAGTLVRAFTQLSKTTAAQALASQAVVRHLKGPLTVSTIPSVSLDRVLIEVNKQKISLAQQIANAETATPLPAPPIPAAALAARTAALQPVRLKLEAIWRSILSNNKFDAAINTLKADAAKAPIITNIDTAPANATERQHLTALFWLQTALNKDTDLNRELLSILMANNP